MPGKHILLIGLAVIVSLFGYIGYAWLSEANKPRPDLDLPLAPLSKTAFSGLDSHGSLPGSLPGGMDDSGYLDTIMPALNPMVAPGVNPMPHGESAQQDATLLAGPIDTSRRLQPDELAYVHLGPGYFGAYTSGMYPDNRRLLWVNGVNGLYKIDYESYEILDHLPTEEAAKFTREWAENITAKLDEDNSVWSLWTAVEALKPLMSLSGIYAVVGRNNWFYLANKDGSVTAYGDSVEGELESKIEQKAKFQLPSEQAGPSVGMNMTYDGWIIFPTENGYLIAVSQDLSEYRTIRLKHADEEDLTSQGVGYGWVRNSVAIDAAGGVYVASRNHMHKVVWDGNTFSTNEKDGAWTARYRNGTDAGTGATPSLMGFGDEDKFVVITDGDIRMNVTLFWRNQIPQDWVALSGAPSRRIAGIAPASMGKLDAKKIQSEQTVIVAGYGALVVNNRPRNIPFFFPKDGQALGTLIGPLGSNPHFQPYGVQKFQWNPKKRLLELAWVNEKLSSPSGVPWVSLGSGQVYFIGARNNEWTLEAASWLTGKPTFHYIIGGQKFNNEYSGPVIDDEGRIFYGTIWGRARIQPKHISTGDR